jgi:hypothetical protein
MKRITAIHILESPSSVDPRPDYAYVANIQYQDDTGVRSFENIGMGLSKQLMGLSLADIIEKLRTFKV